MSAPVFHMLEHRLLLKSSIIADGFNVTVLGTDGPDVITISQSDIFPGPHAIITLNGRNTDLDVSNGAHYEFFINCRGGNDSIYFASSFDLLRNSTILGGRGDDVIGAVSLQFINVHVSGGGGNDKITLSAAANDLAPGTQAVVTGDDGDDFIIDDDSNVLIDAGNGNDSVSAGPGTDTILGGAGDDIISGGAGKDVIYGVEGNDILDGGDGDDRLFGNAGNDTLIGNQGNDTLIGGPGHDFNYPDAPSSRLRRYLQSLFE